MKIKEIMSSPVYVVSPMDNIARARNLMLRHKIGRLVVTDDGNIRGIVTKKDIMRRLDQAEPTWRRRPIDDIPIKIVMTEEVITIFPDATPAQLAELMIENNISGLPVVNNKNEIMGIVTKWDLIRWFSEQEVNLRVKDMEIEPAITVHRHHTITQVIHELDMNYMDRAIVVEGNNMPVGIITSSNLAFTVLRDKKGALPQKDIKMTRKESYAGRKQNRYVKEVPLVAEDIMSTPLITVNCNESATHAAGIMVRERINGLPVVDNGIMGMLTGDSIVKQILTM